MFLRKQLEKRVPVFEGEQALSERARDTVFRGGYLLTSKITDVEQTLTWRSTSKDAYPYQLKITREYSDGTKSFSGGGYDSVAYRKPLHDVEDEMRNPGALNRANRIERIGRRIKLGFSGLVLAGVVGLIGYGVVRGGEENTQNPTTETTPQESAQDCNNVVTGSELLVPVMYDATDAISGAGHMICELNNQDYLVIQQPTNR